MRPHKTQGPNNLGTPACPGCGVPLAPGQKSCDACTLRDAGSEQLAMMPDVGMKATKRKKVTTTKDLPIGPAGSPTLQDAGGTPALRGSDASALPRTPTILGGKYEIICGLGSGGMGSIYKARQLLLKKDVAIKVMRSNMASEEAKKRFEHEARAASSLSHPNIVSVHDFGFSESGDPYMVMDYVEGQTLSAELKTKGQLPIDECLRVFIQVCDGLSHAHKRGILHRDLKPSNLMVTRGDGGHLVVKIVDFGIAKILETKEDTEELTRTGQTMGSPAYMSPEQCRGQKNIDGRADIYSLGCVFYQCLAGVPPYTGDSVIEVIMKHVEAQPIPAVQDASLGREIPPELNAIVSKMVQKDPANRYQSMDDVKADLIEVKNAFEVGREAEIDGADSTESQVDAERISAFRSSRTKRAVLILGVVAACGVGLFGFYRSRENLGAPSGSPSIVPPPPATAPAPAPSSTDEFLHMALKSGNVQQDLNFAGRDLTDTGLKYFQDADIDVEHPPQVKRLDISHTAVTSEGIKGITGLRLRYLNATGTQIDDAAINSIRKIRSILGLSLAGTKITNTGVHLLNNPTLIDLSMSNTAIDDHGLQELANHHTLGFLYLENDKITDNAIQYLDSLHVLMLLDLRKTQVTDEGIALLPRVSPKLNQLYVGGNNLTDKSLTAIGKMKDLFALDISGANVTDKGLDALGSKLAYLDLSGTRVTDDGVIKLLKREKRLGSLYLKDTNVTDRIMPYVGALTHIDRLDLRGTHVTDEGLLQLRNCKSLRQLAIDEHNKPTLARKELGEVLFKMRFLEAPNPKDLLPAWDSRAALDGR